MRERMIPDSHLGYACYTALFHSRRYINSRFEYTMALGTPAQQKLANTFFGPFFNWDGDEKLRKWLQEQAPDELEQFLNWFDFSHRRDRETLGRQELAKLRRSNTKLSAFLK